MRPEQAHGIEPDMSDPVQRTIARDVGFDLDAPDRVAFANYMEAYFNFIDAKAALGDEALELLTTPVPDAYRKLTAIREHLMSGRSLASVERVLRIPWQEQVRMAANGHETRLWTWQLEEKVDFEEMVRAGASIRSLMRTFRLPERQVENLVKLFR